MPIPPGTEVSATVRPGNDPEGFMISIHFALVTDGEKEILLHRFFTVAIVGRRERTATCWLAFADCLLAWLLRLPLKTSNPGGGQNGTCDLSEARYSVGGIPT